MSLDDLFEQGSRWLADTGPHADVAVSSRVRLARNLAGFPFLGRATVTQRRQLIDTCRNHIVSAELAPRLSWVNLAEIAKVDRQLLAERHLISRQHSRGDGPRGVAIADNETVAIMVNEEDHLRIQVLRSGMQLEAAYEQADRIDDLLESRVDYAYSSKLGYLTACPTNVGTGIRVSVMLHLPALKLTGEIDKLQRAAKDMHLALRGSYGEGTEALGDLFQVSNQTTLGRTDQQILNDFQSIVIPGMIDYERRARRALADQRQTVLDDRVFRAWGTLANARLLGSEEALYLLSYVRLGASLGRLDQVTVPQINQLMQITQPAHLQKLAGHGLSGPARRQFRAEFIRSRLRD